MTAQEAIVQKDTVALALRPGIGFWKYVTVEVSLLKVQGIETSTFLAFKEKLSEQRNAHADTVALLNHHKHCSSMTACA